jgi:hypothetical protein
MKLSQGGNGSEPCESRLQKAVQLEFQPLDLCVPRYRWLNQELGRSKRIANSLPLFVRAVLSRAKNHPLAASQSSNIA